MAWNERTIHILHDLAKGCAVKDSEATETGTVQYFPEVYYSGDSFALALSVYADYAAATLADFGASATAKLYCKIANTADVPVLLATGTIGQADGETAYSEVSFTVAAGDTDAFDGQSCLLYVLIEDTGAGGQLTISETLNIASLDGDGTANPTANQMAYTPDTPGDWSDVPDDVAEALDTLAEDLQDMALDIDTVETPSGTTVAGLLYYLSGGAWVLADADIDACADCELFAALGTDPETDGMAAQTMLSGGSAYYGPYWLADSGAMTTTEPTGYLRVSRIVGWGRGSTIRFDGHVPGTLIETS